MRLLLKTYYLVLTSVLLVHLSCTSQSKIELLDYSSSECKEGIFFKNLPKLKNRILKINKTDSFHTYEIFVVANCSGTEEGKIELKNDTLNLIFDGKWELDKTSKTKENDSTETISEVWIKELADCDCAYNLSYKIKGLKNKDYIITINGKKIIKTEHKYRIIRTQPKFEIIKNDTINFVDIYGLKQGLHITYKNDGRLLSRINYIDDEKIVGLDKVRYNWRGFDKVETYIENKKYTVRKYYRNEKLIKICDTDGTFDEGTNCSYKK